MCSALAGDSMEDLQSKNLTLGQFSISVLRGGRCWAAAPWHHNAYCFAYGLVIISEVLEHSLTDLWDQTALLPPHLALWKSAALKTRYPGADRDLTCTLPFNNHIAHAGTPNLSESLSERETENIFHLWLPRGLTCLTGLTLYIRL